jgi:hypothetical protein
MGIVEGRDCGHEDDGDTEGDEEKNLRKKWLQWGTKRRGEGREDYFHFLISSLRRLRDRRMKSWGDIKSKMECW